MLAHVCRMSNVIRLVARKHEKNDPIALSEPGTGISTAVRSFLESTGQLGNVVKDLSVRFDAIENVIDKIPDPETRNRLKHSTELSRQTLLKAMLQLTQQIEKLVGCRRA